MKPEAYNKQYFELFGPGLLPEPQRFDPELTKLFWDISINRVILEVLEIFRKNLVEIAKRSKECHEVSRKKSEEETAALRRIEPIVQPHAPHFLHFPCLARIFTSFLNKSRASPRSETARG